MNQNRLGHAWAGPSSLQPDRHTRRTTEPVQGRLDSLDLDESEAGLFLQHWYDTDDREARACPAAGELCQPRVQALLLRNGALVRVQHTGQLVRYFAVHSKCLLDRGKLVQVADGLLLRDSDGVRALPRSVRRLSGQISHTPSPRDRQGSMHQDLLHSRVSQ